MGRKGQRLIAPQTRGHAITWGGVGRVPQSVQSGLSFKSIYYFKHSGPVKIEKKDRENKTLICQQSLSFAFTLFTAGIFKHQPQQTQVVDNLHSK